MIYWFFGIWFMFMGMIIITSSYDANIMQYMQKNLTYDKMTYLLGLVVICIGGLYLSEPLSKIIAKNKAFQRFYLKHHKGDIPK